MFNRVISGIVVTAMCLTMLMGCNKMDFDQTTDKNELLTEIYSTEQIEELKKISYSGETYTFANLKNDFEIQCVRKTHQGYYVVLLLDEGGNAFIFFDKENTLVSVILLNSVKSKTEFENQIKERMTQKEVLNFDSNIFLSPISAIEISIHFVKEGIFIVEYSRYEDGKVIEDPVFVSLTFIGNENIPTHEDFFIRDVIPFIYEFDKMS